MNGAPSSPAARQVHSSHLPFIRPLCAIEMEERDGMEWVMASTASGPHTANKAQQAGATNQIKNLIWFGLLWLLLAFIHQKQN